MIKSAKLNEGLLRENVRPNLLRHPRHERSQACKACSALVLSDSSHLWPPAFSHILHHFVTRSKFLFALVIAIFLPIVQLSAQENSLEPIKIGAVAALSGPGALWGEMASSGWRLAVEEANASGGIAGRKVELILEDSRSSSTGSVSAYKKLLNVDKVVAMTGDVWDFLTTPLIPLADSSKRLLISTTIEQSTTKRSPYFFTSGVTLPSIAGELDKFFSLHPTAKRVGFISWDNEWGYGYEAEIKKAVERAGATIVELQRSADFTNDWRTEVMRVLNKKPDLIVFLYPASTILKRLNEAKFQGPLLTTSNIVEDLSQRSIPNNLTEGVYYADWRGDVEFEVRFSKRFGKEPILNALDGYDGMRALIRALAIDLKDPRAGLLSVKFQGVAGPIDFTSGGTSGNFAHGQLFRITSGKGERVLPRN